MSSLLVGGCGVAGTKPDPALSWRLVTAGVGLFLSYYKDRQAAH
jgi:hypothetical protein